MKIELIDKESFSIFMNRLYISECDFTSKDDITDVVKTVIYKLKNKLHLRGFYKIKVYVHNLIGLFLDVVQLEENHYSNSLDLRVIIYFDEDFFFEVDDYFIIKDASSVWHLDNKYYCNVDEIKKDFYSILEFGRFIYGEDVIHILNDASIV